MTPLTAGQLRVRRRRVPGARALLLAAPLLSLAVLAAGAHGQASAMAGPFAVGTALVAVHNPLAGTDKLKVHLYYPAQSPGSDAPPETEHGPYPLVVFGHGLGNNPQPYAELLQLIASWGLIVAAPDSATYGPQALLAQDMLGTAAGLEALGHGGSAVPFPYLAPGVVAMSGHSLGGGAALIAGALMPECDAVLALAPWNAPASVPEVPSAEEAAALLQAPLAIVVGSDDAIAPLSTNSLPLYAGAMSVKRLRLLSVVAGAGHNDPLLMSQVGNDGTAFLRAYLCDDAAALDEVYGPSAQSDPLATLSFDVVDPDCFLTGEAAAGQVLGVHAAASTGSTLLTVAATSTVAGMPKIPGLLLPPGAMIVLQSGLTGPSQLLSLQLALPADLTGVPQLTWYLQSVRLLPGGGADCSPLRSFTLQP